MMMKQLHIYLFVATVAGISACNHKHGNSAPEDSEPVPVITMKIEKRMVEDQISISGNIEGDKTVRLGFQVAGKINYIAASEGQQVAKGILLSSLEPTNYSIARDMAQAQLNQAKDEYARLKIMHDRQSLSESDFAKITHTLEQAEAQQKLQTKNLADTRLYSPITGVLLRKNAEVGEIVGTGTPVFVLSDISTVKVNAYIPENELHKIRIGQEASVYISSVNNSFNGKIIEVGSAADPTSRAFTVKIQIPNPQLLIRPGMIAEVKIDPGGDRTLLTVPTEAVLKNLNNQNIVYVADLDKKRAYVRKVSIGQFTDNYIEILSGLNPGEIIVTAGQNKLTDGAPITENK
ncbi:efflux RND transporter periplasmic adaptor subunit [Chitinophaga sp. 30R24]|uniref:efflux RND transporter periplasmic adaptor subunit n=1 Tax=Chitinophaga sp. 30R24 TaxID=3248838 RepID=UPI003B8FF426